jgi:hypothetical protein
MAHNKPDSDDDAAATTTTLQLTADDDLGGRVRENRMSWGYEMAEVDRVFFRG